MQQQLGPARFRLINDVGRDALVKGGFTKEEEVGVEKGKKSRNNNHNIPHIHQLHNMQQPAPSSSLPIIIIILNACYFSSAGAGFS
jgi:hypothetical protein